MRTKKDGSFMCIGALLFLTFFSVIMLTIPGAMAEGAVDTVQINITESCSMSGVVNTAHTKTIQSDHLEEDIGTTNIKIVCNDASGFAVYAIGYTDDEYGKTVLTDSTLGSTSDIATGLATSGNTSSWAMKLAKAGSTYSPIIAGSSEDTHRQTGDTDYSGYAVVPSEYAKVVYRLASTDVGTGASGSNFTTTYRVFISRAQLAGTYVGQVKYTLVHPNTAPAPMVPLDPSVALNNTIVYAPNTSDTQGDMSSLGTTTKLSTASPTAGRVYASPNSTIKLIAPNFYREGYGFAGWSTDFEATSTSTIYGPNETISTNPTNGGLDVSTGAILYPVWVASAGNLQGWNNCNSLTTAPTNTRATLSSITALTDTRDGNVYAVARLADGKCWMIENLRLNNEYTISAENIAKAQGYGDATASTNNGVNASNNNLGRFIGLAASEDSGFGLDGSTTANSLYSIDGSNGTTNINSNYNAAYRFPRYNKNNTNMTLNATNSDGATTLTDSYNTNNNHVRWYGYGNYYNWPAAIADTNYYYQNNVSVTNTSICPTGWHLPQGGQAYAEGDTSGVNVTGDTSTYRDFYNLGYALVGTTAYENTPNGGRSYYNGTNYSKLFTTFPNNFVYSGYWKDTYADFRVSYGFYWSSSASSSDFAYYLEFSSSGVYPGVNRNKKSSGLSVRCIVGS